MRNEELKLAIILFAVGIIFCSLMSWYSGNMEGERKAIEAALPPCHHASVGQEYGSYICMGKYDYMRKPTND